MMLGKNSLRKKKIRRKLVEAGNPCNNGYYSCLDVKLDTMNEGYYSMAY